MVTWQEFMVAIDTVGREILQKCWGARYCHTIRVWYIYTCAFGIEMMVNVEKYTINGPYGYGMVVERCRRVKHVKSTKKKLSSFFHRFSIFESKNPMKINWKRKDPP